MSAADIATIAGAFLAAVISGFGLRRGEAEKRSLPAADERLSAGVFVGLDAETQRSILDELREMHADMASWRRADEYDDAHSMAVCDSLAAFTEGLKQP